MSQCCCTNGLILNQQKTAFIMFSPIGTKLDLSLLIRGVHNLHQNNSVKFLGVHIDNELKLQLGVANCEYLFDYQSHSAKPDCNFHS